jgi:hypothetical protein
MTWFGSKKISEELRISQSKIAFQNKRPHIAEFCRRHGLDYGEGGSTLFDMLELFAKEINGK